MSSATQQQEQKRKRNEPFSVESISKDIDVITDLLQNIKKDCKHYKKLIPSLPEVGDRLETVCTTLKDTKKIYRNKYKVATERVMNNSNHGLNSPQYFNAEIAKFINGYLTGSKIPVVNGHGIFNHNCNTCFWNNYIKENGLHSTTDKTVINLDQKIKNLCNSVKIEGKTLFELFIDSVSRNPKLKVVMSPSGQVESIGYASVQVLFKPAFTTGYTIPDKESYIPQLASISKELREKIDAYNKLHKKPSKKELQQQQATQQPSQ